MIFTKTRVSSSVFADDFFLRGNEYYEKGLYDEAITDYTKALEINPNHTSALFYRGTTYLKRSRYDEAIADYTKALEIKPNHSMALNNRAAAYDDKKMYDEAIVDYTKALEIDPDYADAWNNRGVSYNNKGLYDKAIADYTKALKIDPNHVSAWYNRGLAYKKKKLYDKAIADYTKALEINPNYTNALWHRGVAYLKKGLFEEAIADSKKFISLQFPDEPSENLVGYFRCSDIEEAALFMARLINKGFYAICTDGKSGDMLVCPHPKKERSVLFFDKLHIGKTISRHLRQNKDRYELRFDEGDKVFEHIIARSYERHNDTLQESNLKIFRALRAMDGMLGRKGLPRPVSFALYKDGCLAAGEWGVIAGRVYSSYSGYYEPDAPSAGLAQVILMARYLEKRGFAFLDLGPPAGYAYKDRLGAVEMSYTDFKTLFLNSI